MAAHTKSEAESVEFAPEMVSSNDEKRDVRQLLFLVSPAKRQQREVRQCA